jgi:hypothetical protein
MTGNPVITRDLRTLRASRPAALPDADQKNGGICSRKHHGKSQMTPAPLSITLNLLGEKFDLSGYSLILPDFSLHIPYGVNH